MEKVKTIEDVLEVASKYLHEDSLTLIKKAYIIAE